MVMPGTCLGQQALSAEAGWGAITRCAAAPDADARHACVDDVLRRSGMLTAAAESASARKRFGLPPPVPRAAAPEQASAAGSPQPHEHGDDQLVVTLAQVDQGGDGKLALTTTESAVWRQVESTAVRPIPVPGQTMAIARTSFGGFMCKYGKWVAFRCYRVR
jgi:hypothetical protein